MHTPKKFVLVLVGLLLLIQGSIWASDKFIEPWQVSSLFGTTGSVQTDAVGSFINPALGATMPSMSTQMDTWVFADPRNLQLKSQWAYFYADPFTLMGLYSTNLPDNSNQIDVHLGFSGGNRSVAFGIANISVFNQQHAVNDYFHALQAGLLLRPIQQLSLGATFTQNYINSQKWNLYVDGGLRPFGSNLLTLYGAWSASDTFTDPNTQRWQAGVSVAPTKGFELYGKYNSTGSLTLGFTLRYGMLGLGSSLYSDKQDFSGSLTAGAGLSFTMNKDGFAMKGSSAAKSYLELSLGNLSAAPSLFNSSSSLFTVLETIHSAKKDPAIEGLILNTTSLIASRSDLWELRSVLEDFKKSGKKVIAFIQVPTFDIYALASVADRIVMDSQGVLSFDGYVAGRGYYKHTLEKLGIGFRELKYFTYKSAAESFSRDSFSEADKEQYEAYLDSIFNATKQLILTGRKLSSEQFATLLEDNFLLSAKEAKTAALVDALGREEAIRMTIRDLSGKEYPVQVFGNGSISLFQKGSMPMMGLMSTYRITSQQQDVWGEPPHIAIVYANGETALQGGMNARTLAKIIDDLAQDTNVKAIVLRVDSPGGDAIAADYVAEAVKKATEQKPVYVSMGSVAGSGGYWVSMYGTNLYATPYTITGSIGVIASWFYDAGLNNKLGFSIDLLKRGSHADLQAGIILPYRDLNDAEIKEYHQWILELYDDFVAKVAAGRNMDENKVRELAQGRIYSGNDAVQNGLIDGIGGLRYTLAALRESLNLPEDAEVVIDEYPYPDPFTAFLEALGQTSLPKGYMAKLAALFIHGVSRPNLSPLALSTGFYETVEPRIVQNGKVQAIMPLEVIELNQGTESFGTVKF